MACEITPCVISSDVVLSDAVSGGNIYDCLHFQAPSEQIRLLFICPGQAEDEISCRLEVFDAHRTPPYRAISYTWGDPADTCDIKMNSRRFTVRKNCWFVLWQARLRFASSYIWVDAVCINQDDVDEKSVQVARMYEIYTSAVLTVACLGDDDATTRFFHAANEMPIWKDRCERLEREGNYPTSTILRREHCVKLAQQGENREAVMLQELEKDWRQFCERPYFTRLWIVQELHASRATDTLRVLLLSGREALEWTLAIEFYDFCERELSWYSMSLHKGWFFEDLDYIMNQVALPISQMVRWINRFQCFDPRDHIYGCLQLIKWPHGKSQALRPDYRLSNVELCLQIVGHLMHDPLVQFMELDLIADTMKILSVQGSESAFREWQIHTALRRLPESAEYKLLARPSFKAAYRIARSENELVATLASDSIECEDGQSHGPGGRTAYHPGSFVSILNVRGDVVALACSKVEHGDYLLVSSLLSDTGSGVGYGIIVRPLDKSNFMIIGQAVFSHCRLTRFSSSCTCSSVAALLPRAHGRRTTAFAGLRVEIGFHHKEAIVFLAQAMMTLRLKSLCEAHNLSLDLELPSRQIMKEDSVSADGASLLAHIFEVHAE